MNLPARISLACSVMLMLAIGAAVFLHYPPDKFSIYPQCHLHQLTGLFCPGCGSTRCLHAMLQGHFAEAAQKNMMALAVLPFIGGCIAFWSWNWVVGRPVRWRGTLNGRLGIALILLLITFGLLRNLPWYPFTLLAPH